MTLIIKAISYKGLTPFQEIRAHFDTLGGSIGRSPDNHLVLPDPDKFISRLHASIEFVAGQYYIQDRSTGGTYLIDSDHLLQQNRAPLNDGEKLRIGEYELLVTIQGAVSASGIDMPVRQLDFADGAPLIEPFSAVPRATAKPEADFFASFLEQPESSAIHQSFTPPQVAGLTTAVTDEIDFGDLLSTLDALPSGSNRLKPLPTSDLPPLPADFFDDVVHPESLNLQASVEIDPFADLQFEEPQKMVHSQAAEPAYDVFIAEPGRPVPSAEPVRPKPSPTPVSVAPEKLPDAMFSHVADISGTQPTPPIVNTQTVSDADIRHAEERLIKAFLAGAGVSDADFVPREQWPALMRTSGELLRSMVEGLMQVLRARAELKSQFRVAVTTMRSADNNPLKFTPNADDAIRLILAPTHPGFLPPKAAISEGFRDTMNHQIAMTAGIQAALVEILRSFDPQQIEKTQGEGVLFQKKAKCWEYYVEKYPQLKAIAQEEFFGEAFADAYEKQMMLLSRSSSHP